MQQQLSDDHGTRIALFGFERFGIMDALVIGTTLLGTFWGAYVIQKAALQKLIHLMGEIRRGQ
jgi:hypothetical protein